MKNRKFSRNIKKTPTPCSQQVQNIPPNLSSRTSTRNRSSTKKTDGSGVKKYGRAVDESKTKEEDWILVWDGPPTSWRAGGLVFILIWRG